LLGSVTSSALIVFLVALAARLIFLFEFSSLPIFSVPIMDMLFHHQWAHDIIAGRGSDYTPFFRAPLYPHILALVYGTLGDGDWPIRVLQALLGSLSAVLVYLIGRRIFGPTVGMISALLTALWGPLIFYDGQLLPTSFAIFLNLLALHLLVRAHQEGGQRPWLLGGLVLGLSATTRPTVLLFATVVIMWGLARALRSGAAQDRTAVVAFTLALAMPLGSVATYNFVHSGSTAMTGTYGGLNFYIGNHARSDGVSAKIPGARQDWRGMMEDAALIAEGEAGRELSPDELSRFWLRKGWQEIGADPQRWIVHLFDKSVFLLQGIELSNNFDFYYFALKSRLLQLLIWRYGVFAPWGVFFPLAVYGLILAWRRVEASRLPTLFFGCTCAAVVMFFVTTRYRLPLAPFVAIFATYAVAQIYASARTRRWKACAVAAVIILPLMGLANTDVYRHTPRSDAPGLFTMATTYLEQNQTAKAEQYYRASVDADPTFIQAYNDLGLLLAESGRAAEAIDVLRAGLDLVPDHVMLRYNLGYVCLIANRPEDAVIPLRSLLTDLPDHIDARMNLASAFYTLDDFDSARVQYEHALGLRSDVPAALSGLGWSLLELAHYDSALTCFRASVGLGYDVPNGYYNLGQIWMRKGNRDSAIANLQRCRLELEATSPEWVPDIQLLIDSLRAE
jgi:Tfp pilus assembly protein PilF